MMKRKSQSDHYDRMEGAIVVGLGASGENAELHRGASPQSKSALDRSPESPAEESGIHSTSRPDTSEWTSVTTRKSKACSSCRKQKVQSYSNGKLGITDVFVID
jgi:hypothetical protein